MRPFEYADSKIGGKELVYIIASMSIGVGILTLPRLVATHTKTFDGWISILAAGLFFMFFGWLLAKVVSTFSQKNFFEYCSLLLTKPIAFCLTIILALTFLFTCSLEARVVANISKLYMFDRTPIEAVTLVFILVVVYAVMGTRIALLRLNMMFLPIVLGVTLLVQGFNIPLFEIDSLRPTFTTPLVGYWRAAQETVFSYIGYVVILVYISLMKNPKDAPKMTILGIGIPIVLYLIIFAVAVGVFGNMATAQITYPTIEIAKEIQAPGGFLERFESIFFTVWIMTIFNTASMALDIVVHLLKSIFSIKKNTLIFILSPLVFLISITPENTNQIQMLGKVIAGIGLFYGVILAVLLYIVQRIKGVHVDAEN
ncbi:spore germination protein [Bacillus mesophilus]|uniref:Endospore germination permease n=1 Tax=Bacillus mesophilus TaxID=1808955 RepID=A0A6M0QDM8_9BACI|nr:endospore germination permease [Bacillus mesophilus]MBM7662974.1 spore germination protein [Bacillus mesophilus]NEY73700.1 endospore germination permease [Bacillus mesophilus]